MKKLHRSLYLRSIRYHVILESVPVTKLCLLAEWLDLFREVEKNYEYETQEFAWVLKSISSLVNLPFEIEALRLDEVFEVIKVITELNFDDNEKAEKPTEEKAEVETKDITREKYVANRITKLIHLGLAQNLESALEIAGTISAIELEYLLEEQAEYILAPNKDKEKEKKRDKEIAERLHEDMASGKITEQLANITGSMPDIGNLKRPTSIPENTPKNLEEAIALAEKRKKESESN